MSRRRCALITGGNRGIGFAVGRALARSGHDLLLASRDPERGRVAADELRAHGTDVQPVTLDLEDAASIDRLLADLDDTPVDVLVNNAGVYPRSDPPAMDDFRRCMEVHVFGPLALIRGLSPGMAQRGWGRIVNVSSGSGSFAEGLPGPTPYSSSKAALNALTVKLSRELPESIRINAACPGWVRTRMGGPAAPRSVDEGADTIAWLATLPDDGPTGGFFRLREPIAW